MSGRTKTITMMDATDLSTECQQLVEEFLESRGYHIDNTAAWAQNISNSRMRIVVNIDMEKWLTPPTSDEPI